MELGWQGGASFEVTADLCLNGGMERPQPKHTIRELLVNHGVSFDQSEARTSAFLTAVGSLTALSEAFEHKDFFTIWQGLKQRADGCGFRLVTKTEATAAKSRGGRSGGGSAIRPAHGPRGGAGRGGREQRADGPVDLSEAELLTSVCVMGAEQAVPLPLVHVASLSGHLGEGGATDAPASMASRFFGRKVSSHWFSDRPSVGRSGSLVHCLPRSSCLDDRR